jgi:hypothetical protein
MLRKSKQELMDQQGKRKFDLPTSNLHQVKEDKDEEMDQWQLRYISLFVYYIQNFYLRLKERQL